MNNYILEKCIKKYDEKLKNKKNKHSENISDNNGDNNKCIHKCVHTCEHECSHACNDDEKNKTPNIIQIHDVMTEFMKTNMNFYMSKVYELNDELESVKNENKELNNKIKSSYCSNKKKIIEQNKKLDKLEQCIIDKCDNFTLSQNTSYPQNICFTDALNIHYYIIPENIKVIFVTIVAGGGAGGIGHCANQYFYSGGGGGAGACIIKKPLYIEPGTTLSIKIGGGGESNTNKTGEDSYIEYIDKCHDPVKITVKGGNNGYPLIIDKDCKKLSGEVQGGEGGKTCYPYLSGYDGCDGKLIMANSYNFNGVTGCSGEISYPSGPTTIPGDGGCSLYEDGGNGGTNYFASGGICGSQYNSIGENGSFGSGGGGSCPKYKLDFCSQLSGNGGNGIVIIELGNCECVDDNN